MSRAIAPSAFATKLVDLYAETLTRVAQTPTDATVHSTAGQVRALLLDYLATLEAVAPATSPTPPR